jgi:hypothetical protein
MSRNLTRRGFGAGGAALISTLAYAQGAPQLGTPLSVISTPPRDFGPRGTPVLAPDPDIIRLDRSFGDLLIGQETIRRISTGYPRRKVRPGTAKANTPSSATSRTTRCIVMSGRAARSPLSASRRTAPTAIASISGGARSPPRNSIAG